MTSKMNRTKFNEVIHASKDRVWDVLFHQYGDIYLTNGKEKPLPKLATDRAVQSSLMKKLNQDATLEKATTPS